MRWVVLTRPWRSWISFSLRELGVIVKRGGGGEEGVGREGLKGSSRRESESTHPMAMV